MRLGGHSGRPRIEIPPVSITRFAGFMIETLDTFPSPAVAFVCSGRGRKSDYDTVLVPAVRKALQTHQSVRLHYETTAEFRISLPAAREDLRLGVEHLRHWERVAVVTDGEWIVHAIQALRFLLPHRVKMFPRSQAELAWAWMITGISPEIAKMTNIS
jgi:SpoIIAA-like